MLFLFYRGGESAIFFSLKVISLSSFTNILFSVDIHLNKWRVFMKMDCVVEKLEGVVRVGSYSL